MRRRPLPRPDGSHRSSGRPSRPPGGARGFAAVAIALLAQLSAASATSASARGQEDEEIRRHGIFIDSVEVSLVSVEVFATRDGEPVTDLTIDDLEVLVDGEPVEVTSLTWVAGQRPGDGESFGDEAEAGDVAIEKAAAETAAAETAAAWTRAGNAGAEASEPESAGRSEPASVIVLVDQLFLSPISRVQVFEALAAQLEPLIDGGARILVATKSREDVRIVQDFTDDRRQVLAAFDRLGDLAPPGYTAEIRTTIDLWGLAPKAVESRQTGPDQPEPSMRTSELDAQSAYQEARSITERMHADVTGSLGALHRFLDSLAGLPGRKALIYVADQLPVRPAELLWRMWWEEYGVEHGSRLGASPRGPSALDATGQLEELIADATTSRVAFYPVGAGGGVDLAGAAGRGAPTQSGVPMVTPSSAAGDGLQWLSQRTGGRGAVGSSAIGSAALEGFFGDLTRDLGAYYSLAFPSPHQGDGELHRLEVRARRPGVRLRHPTEYRDKSAEQRMADRTLSTLTLGVEDNPLDVRVEVGKAKQARKGGRATVPLEIRVPMANLVLLPDARVHRGKLSIQLIARDDRGRVSDPVLVRMPLEVVHRDLAWALTQTVDYATEMTLQAGGGAIAIGVHDDYGFTSSTVGVDIGRGDDD
ncbi:MAG TPA: VWA domain-containing protein [Thermoanaerobaculia bacterium]|nr:VWA domain-containing protein [Thermoanaerobaculia bacterium]